MQWAGAVAFYLVLSVPPLLIAASSIAVFAFGEETAIAFLTTRIDQFVPVERAALARLAEQTVTASGPAALVSIALLLFSGTRVFAALIAAIYVMWEDIERAGFFRVQLVRTALLLSVGALFLMAAAVDVAVGLLAGLLALPTPLVWLVQSHAIPVLLTAGGLFVLYFVIPRRSATWQSALVGALLAAITLRLAQALFTTYLAVFGSFESAYGPVAGVAVLMTWALVASAVVLLAAHLVAAMNRHDAPAEPPGLRGAREG